MHLEEATLSGVRSATVHNRNDVELHLKAGAVEGRSLYRGDGGEEAARGDVLSDLDLIGDLAGCPACSR